jgi:hypothetical protein
MRDNTANLTAEQAEAAVFYLHDLIPSDLWQGGVPAWTSVELAAEELKERSSGEAQAFVSAFLAGGGRDSRGQVARIVLNKLAADPALRPHVEEAIRRSRQPHMAEWPDVIIAWILILPLLPRIAREDGKTNIVWDPTDQAIRLIDSLAGFVKALPSGVIDAFIGPRS